MLTNVQVASQHDAPLAALSEAVLRLLADARRAVSQDPQSADGYLEQAARLLRGASALPEGPVLGGLAPWQMRLVRDHIMGHLAEALPISDLARVSRLSQRHFARAFKASFGVAPHTFVMHRRIERAKAMILESDVPLAEIALACGLCDQSHMTRLFSRFEGATPAVWRRCNAECPA